MPKNDLERRLIQVIQGLERDLEEIERTKGLAMQWFDFRLFYCRIGGFVAKTGDSLQD